MRDLERRLRALEGRPATFTEEQWARLSCEDLAAMAELPTKAGDAWDIDRWTDGQRRFADAIYRKAMGEVV